MSFFVSGILGCGDSSHLPYHLSEPEESRWVQDLCFPGCITTQQGVSMSVYICVYAVETRSLHTLCKKTQTFFSLHCLKFRPNSSFSSHLGLPKLFLFSNCCNNERGYFGNLHNFFQSQKFTYISIIFGSIAFKLCVTWVKFFGYPSISFSQ